MLVPEVTNMECLRVSGLQSSESFLTGGLTSVGSDVLDVLLGVFDLDGRPWDQFLVPAAHVVVEVDNAEVVVDGQVVQDGLHGLHGLCKKRRDVSFCAAATGAGVSQLS